MKTRYHNRPAQTYKSEAAETAEILWALLWIFWFTGKI